MESFVRDFALQTLVRALTIVRIWEDDVKSAKIMTTS
jgi:hypothetical protein